MRLLPVWVLALAGWAASAAPEGLGGQEGLLPQGEDLGPALKDIRKRAGAKSNLPYSNYRPLAGIHRYRYPLYRKRSYQPQYDYEEDLLLPEAEEGFPDYYFDYAPRPSLFRERNLREEEEEEEEEGVKEEEEEEEEKRRRRKKKKGIFLADGGVSEGRGLKPFYGVLSPSSAEQFYSAIDSVRRRKRRGGGGGGRYLEEEEEARGDPMIRRKREAGPPSPPPSGAVPDAPARSSNGSSSSPSAGGDRKKRAFSDYFMWEKRAREEEPKDLYDYLTREYFKSIARTVGQKRAALLQEEEEEEKRSAGIEEMLRSPSTLQYMQTKLKETEEEVAREAQETLRGGGEGGGSSQELIDEAVVRLDALERMREALALLQRLSQEDGSHRKRGGGVPPGGRSPAGRRGLPEARGKEAVAEGTKVRKRGNGLPDAFQGNAREDCPVLERILVNCEGASLVAGDEDQAFLHACIRHEVCYMCGSGLGVSGHECDALLSSALEAACSWRVECLSAAGRAFDLLSDAGRYDLEGTCTHDPCVRQLLESR